jgi:hypothetical protein
MMAMSKQGDSPARPEPTAVRAVQLKVTLKHIQPPIWRRLVLSDHSSLGGLHSVIQDAMGWDNSHMHAFSIDQVEYAAPEIADDGGGLCDEDFFLHQVIQRSGQRFTYTYDFGDSWRHEILVEKIEPVDRQTPLPRCLNGARACPREDCGGVGGYAAMLEAKRHPTKERLSYWGDPSWVLGFDPEHFDLAAVNQLLQPVQKK